jgi:hypothetical protein
VSEPAKRHPPPRTGRTTPPRFNPPTIHNLAGNPPSRSYPFVALIAPYPILIEKVPGGLGSGPSRLLTNPPPTRSWVWIAPLATTTEVARHAITSNHHCSRRREIFVRGREGRDSGSSLATGFLTPTRLDPSSHMIYCLPAAFLRYHASFIQAPSTGAPRGEPRC